MESLAGLFKEDFMIGAAITPSLLENQGDFIAKHFSSLTAENEMKFISLHPEREVYDFSDADKIIAFARKNHLKVRGHNLVWHNQVPDWIFESAEGTGVATKEEVLKVMKEHIEKVVGYFKDDVYCWDVVNEAIDDGEGYLRKSKWTEIVGEEFIERAFRFAHRAAPEALLFYNDYNAVKPDKCEKIYTLVKSLIEKDVPINGIGIQGHWNLHWPNEDEVRRAIEKYISLGVKLQITELDLSMFDADDKSKGVTAPTAEMLELQAQRYESFFRLFKEYKEYITAVTFWGVADDYTWLDNFPVIGRKNWPFVFDEKRQAKPAYDRLKNLCK